MGNTNTEHKPLLEVDIRKKLKGFELGISFETGTGCLGILGPSGCGKSMTLKSVAGIISPDSGRIALCYSMGEAAGGRVLYDTARKVNLRPQERRVGYLFQNYALFPNMTVAENIAVGLHSRHFRSMTARKRQERVGTLMERFQLSGLEARYPGQISGGQQQRAALARILAYEPEVLLLDEPFSAMDAYLKEGLRLELANVMKEYGGIAVMVTHDRDEAFQLCDRLMLMDRGSVLAAGDTREMFATPGTCQAARLTGCKNISRIERLGKRRIRALDWKNLELDTAMDVGAEITAVGIRAHEFMPVSEEQRTSLAGRPGANLIPVSGSSISELPFEWYITLDNGLWWKREKNINTHETAGLTPDWLRVEPEALLLLTGEAG